MADLDNAIAGVSLVVPFYNVEEDKLDRCMCSIDRQAFDKLEVIFIDDGSDPAQGRRVRNKCVKRGYVYHRLEHAGAGAARNYGLDVARGKYIAFMDADDTLEPGFIVAATTLLEQTGADIVYGRVRYRFATHDTDYPIGIGAPGYWTLENSDLADLVASFYSSWPVRNEKIPANLQMGPVAKLFRSKILKNVRYPTNVANGEDSIFNGDAAAAAEKVIVCDKVWYNYYQNNGSACYKGKLTDELNRCAFGIQLLEKWPDAAIWQARDCHHALFIAERYLRIGGRGSFGKTLAFLKDRRVVKTFSGLDYSRFNLPIWWRAVCRLMSCSCVRCAHAIIYLKVVRSRLVGKGLR